MKILLPWEILLYRKYMKRNFIDPAEAAGFALMMNAGMDFTVNMVRERAGLPAHYDALKQTTLTGTVTLTKNSSTLEGSGTSFTSQVNSNDYIYVNTSYVKVTGLVLSNTQVSLTADWKAKTQADLTVKVSSVLNRGLKYVWEEETPLADDYLIPTWAQAAFAAFGPFDFSDCV
jgi:hypothetical protein